MKKAAWLSTPQEQLRDFGELFTYRKDFSDAEFSGATYEPQFDAERLRGEMRRVYNIMSDNSWRTLSEISHLTGDPEASVSARLRDLRKRKFGARIVNRRRRGDPSQGLFEYQLI